MIAVREINDPAELPELGPDWERLLALTPVGSYTQSLDWLQAYWNHFSTGKKLRVLVVYDDDQMKGIVPLVVRGGRRWEPARVLTYPMEDWSCYYGPIGPDRLGTLSPALKHIYRTPRDWHMIELPGVDGTLDEGQTKSALDTAGLPAYCDKTDTSGIIDLTAYGSWEAYCASKHSKWRNTLGRQEKKLARRGKVTHVRHRTTASDGTPVEPRWDLYDACEAVASASWQGNTKGNMLNKADVRDFYRECFETATQRGGVDLDLIYVDDQPVALGYSFVYRGRVSVVKVAYHRDFGFEGAGNVLQARMLEESFAQGDHTIELGHEFLYWKRVWITHYRPVHRYVHIPFTSMAAQAVRAKRAIVRRLKSTARTWRPASNPRDSVVTSPLEAQAAD
jgi:CelD/BcsL family acetyltransferase involved in cellulose biosynthesis